MPEHLHPGVYVEEVRPSVLAIEGASTSTAAFIGLAERGPVGRAVLVTSFADYRASFGGYRPDGFLTYAVQGFFDNGGRKAYIVRVAAQDAKTADLVLLDRERAELLSGAPEAVLADVLPDVLAEPVVTVSAASPGRWGNLVDVEAAEATADPVNHFKLVVRFRDEVVETWDDLSLVVGHENYVESVLGGAQSQYIRVRRFATATTDTPAALVSGVLDAAAQSIATVSNTAVISIMLSNVTVPKVTLAKTGKTNGPAVAGEIEQKIRAAVPAAATAEVRRAFEGFRCIFVPGPRPRYVLVSGSDADPRTIGVPAATTGTGETDIRSQLKLDTAATGSAAAVVVPGKALQRGSSTSGNEPATSTDGSHRSLSFSLNEDGFQTVSLDSALSGGDAVAADIQAKVRGIQANRKDPLNETAYAGFEASYTAGYELTFGDPPVDIGTVTFAASATASNDLSGDSLLRLRATGPAGAETTYGGVVGGPLALTPGLSARERTIVSGSAVGSRPAADLSGITDGELRLQLQPPGTPAPAPVNLDLKLAGPGPDRGEAAAAKVQEVVRQAVNLSALGTLPAATRDAVKAALAGFTARYTAQYRLTSGAVRLVDETGGAVGPISSVTVLPSAANDAAPALRLGVTNRGIEQDGAAQLRPAVGEYHVGDNTTGGPVVSVTAGSDGAVPLDGDFVGDAAAGTGLHALDKITDVNLIAIPGIGSSQVVAAGFGYAANRSLQDCFFIADLGGPPRTDPVFRGDVPFVTTAQDARDYLRALPTKNDFGAIYFPWMLGPDPIGRGASPRRWLPPSGVMAGVYARTDAQRGVFKAPAGTEAKINGVLSVPPIGDAEQDILNPIGINVIRSFPVAGIVAWGARTQASDSAWRYVPVRRMAIFLRVSIYNGIQFAVFEPNDDDLWASLRLTIDGFMSTQFRAGAFQGISPAQAYFVRCDSTTTTQADIDSGVVNILVGFAPLKPAEFVVLRLSQKTAQAAT